MIPGVTTIVIMVTATPTYTAAYSLPVASFRVDDGVGDCNGVGDCTDVGNCTGDDDGTGDDDTSWIVDG